MSAPRKLPSGKWQALYHVTEGGRTVQRSAGTFATKRDAADASSAALERVRRGTWVDPARLRVTVAAWAEQWYGLRRAPSPKIRSFLNARIVPYWGAWELGDVRSIHVQQWVNSLTDVAPSTVRELYAVLRQMLDRAVKYGYLARNPCDLVAGDLPVKQPGVYVFLTRGEVDALLAAAPARFRALLWLATATGMRIGELQALQWDAVDLAAGTVHVRAAVKAVGGVGAPKNGKHRRLVVDAPTVEVLREHRRDFGNGEFVFTKVRGGMLDYDNFRRDVWVPTVRAAGLTTAPTLHDLRHYHASALVIAGLDWLVIADRLGHHAPSFTMNTYGRLRHDADDVVLRALEAMVR